MNLYKGIIYSLAMVALMTGCANEAPFSDPSASRETGKLMTRCLAPKWGNTEGVDMSTRAASVPSVDDFKVVISREGKTRDASAEGTVEYIYSEMPEVLTLPVGDYKVYAEHGDNPDSGWDVPYYYGESAFGIDANKITDDVDPIVARLANIRVDIVFHPSLLSAMSSDSKVTVRVGNQAQEEFVPTESRSAYFKYVDQSQTLAATFDGAVDGDPVVVSKTYDNVAPGNHYTITFRVLGIEDDDPGTVNGGITIDTTVEQVDMNGSVDGEKDNILNPDDYNDRPTQGGGEDPDPSKPDQPTPEDPKVPFANELDPADYLADFGGTDNIYEGFDKIDLKKVNEVTDHLYCAWQVASDAEGGFSAFTVDIISDTLTPEELEGVELTDHLDLIEPGEFEDAIKGLGFPVGLKGESEAKFNITGFLSLMTALGSGSHEFKMTVTDANGTSIISLRLHNN